jgi:hypothetical protein
MRTHPMASRSNVGVVSGTACGVAEIQWAR